MIALVAGLLCIFGLGRRDFYTRGEPREALVAQDMLLNQRYVLAAGYGGSVPSKPPLTHWLMTVAAKATGKLDEFSARLPSAICSVFFTVFLFIFLRPIAGDQTALCTALFNLTAVEWMRTATAARVDMVFSASLAGALLCGYRLSRPDRSIAGGIVCTVLLMAAVLAKGPVALLLYFLSLAAWCASKTQLRFSALLQAFGPHCLVMLFAGIGGCLWYLAAYLEQPQAFLDKFYYENVARFLGTQDDEPHSAHAIKLYLMLVAGMLPWSALLGVLMTRRIKVGSLLEWLRGVSLCWRSAPDFARYSAIISLVVVAFFSIPDGKRGVYLLPVYPFLSYLTAYLILERASSPDGLRMTLLFGKTMASLLLAIFVLALIAAGFKVPFEGVNIGRAALPHYLSAIGNYTSVLKAADFAIIIAVMIFALAVIVSGKRLASRFGALQVVSVLVISIWLMLNSSVLAVFTNSLSTKAVAKELIPYIPPDAAVYSFDHEFYGVSFALHRMIHRYEQARPDAGVILLYERDFGRFAAEIPAGSALSVLGRSSLPMIEPGGKVLVLKLTREPE